MLRFACGFDIVHSCCHQSMKIQFKHVRGNQFVAAAWSGPPRLELRTLGATSYRLIRSTKTFAVEEWVEEVFIGDKMAVAAHLFLLIYVFYNIAFILLYAIYMRN